MRQILTALIGSLTCSISAAAADYGTYRPGNSYLTIPAQAPDQCKSYCSGDAQCKGWNFVKVNPVHTICEFNSNPAAPIASAISISGDSNSPYMSGNIIQTRGSTTRVGQVPSPQQARPISGSKRRVIQTQFPAPDPRHQIANYRSRIHSVETPYPNQMIQRPKFSQRPVMKPQLDVVSGPSNAPPTQSYNPAQAQRLTPMLDSTPGVSGITQPAIPQRQKIEPPTVNAEDLSSIPNLSRMPENQPRLSIESALAGGPVAGQLPKNSSLYGSLYDDVKRPRSLDPSDIPLDPDAPIPTVTSVPVETLDVSTF